MKSISIVLIFVLGSSCNVLDMEENTIEPRGKGKYALLIHFFYVVATKLFILKIVYGIIFYAIAVKAWHFVIWLIHYLKKNQSHDHYIDVDHEPVYGHFDKGHHDNDHYGYYYGGDHDPYGYKEYGRVDTNKKNVYDADGSYSVGP